MRGPYSLCACALLSAAALACNGDGNTNRTTAPAPAAVARVTITPATANLAVGGTQQLSATTSDASGNALTGRAIAWSSSNTFVATVTSAGLVQAIAAGTATITATSEGQSGAAVITVVAATQPVACTQGSALALSVGDVRALTPAQIASLCVGGLSTSSEYVMIPFNNSNVAASTTAIELASAGTMAVTTSPSLNPISGPRLTVDAARLVGERVETAFRIRERSDVGGVRFATRARARRSAYAGQPHTQLTNVPANPAIGSIVQLNANVSGNTCTDAAILHPARVVALLKNAMILIDTLSPPGGYTDQELIALSTEFDTLGYGLDTTNFGANTDIDDNGRVAIFFTPGVNEIPQPAGGVIGGLFAARDLFPADTSGCPASNVGEMFYMPVPDPNKTINGNYTSKSELSDLVGSTLVHEFQHLINAGRRIYVNNAADLEEVWLNEGLSHIAEELLYYAVSGNAPFENIDAGRIRSSQAQVDAFNLNQSQNFGRLETYLAAPESNSPFSEIDGLEMRGAIWQLLRYSADQKGGIQRNTWFALVNSTTTGQANFSAVFGNIINSTRNWAIAQFTDDAGFTVPSQFTSPSWNYRSVFGALVGTLPLLTHSLVAGTNVQLALVGGGAAYVRFGVTAGMTATVAATSASQTPPPNIDIILVRTK